MHICLFIFVYAPYRSSNRSSGTILQKALINKCRFNSDVDVIMGIRGRLRLTTWYWTCWWDSMTNTGDVSVMFTVSEWWLCRACCAWVNDSHTLCMWNPVEKDFIYLVPLQLYILMYQFMFLWLFRETFVHCSLYHLLCRANVKVDISWICFVCSAQFVENIDLFFGIFLSAQC